MHCTNCCMKPIPINAGTGQGSDDKRTGVWLVGRGGNFCFFAVSKDWHWLPSGLIRNAYVFQGVKAAGALRSKLTYIYYRVLWMTGATFLQERWGQSMLLRQIHRLTLIAENSFSSISAAETGDRKHNGKLTREELVIQQEMLRHWFVCCIGRQVPVPAAARSKA
jgi:hypothetical protein